MIKLFLNLNSTNLNLFFTQDKNSESLNMFYKDVSMISIILRIFLTSELHKTSFSFKHPYLHHNPQRVFLFQLDSDCEKLQHMPHYHGKA